ncbi:MAG TPA: LLM class flavin-dependent oxidoreductase [Myxococcota bacterium]|nr:LLM class flavin-dependent oxidoreductase [Myxococcota bacterium]
MHVGIGAFFQNPGNALSDAEVYEQELALVDLAEPLGFDSVWGPEHHFNDYIMNPNVPQFLTWVAARTQRVQLGAMVMVIPWHDPVRVAEQFSVLDHMSKGRAILGIGRGLARSEFAGFRVRMDESRPRFLEYAEAIVESLETGTIRSDGHYYKQPPADIRPKPFRSFRGRVYASAISPESSEMMARLGVGIMIFAQKPWDVVVKELEEYRAIYRKVQKQEPPKPIMVQFVAVNEDMGAAREMFDRYVVGYCTSTLSHYEFDNEGLAKISGYEYYGRMARNIAVHGSDTFIRHLADLQVWGTPARVCESLIENARRVGAGSIIGVFAFGGMPRAMARENLQLFAREVLPVLQSHDVGDLGQLQQRRLARKEGR